MIFRSHGLLAIAFAFGMPAVACRAAQSARLAGHYQCGFTDYMWPAAPDDSPTATGGGTMEFESDSTGKILYGTMTQHEADDTRRFGEKACTFNLVSGQSVMTSASAGTATFTWQLKPGSDGHCGAWIRNTANLGLTESVRDYLTFTTTSQFL